MWRNTLIATLVLVAALVAGTTATAGSSRWIHVRVVEDGLAGEKVNVNLPLSVVNIAIEAAGEEAFIAEHVRIDEHDVSIVDLRRMWNELRDVGDAELVDIENRDERVTIARRGALVVIDVQERDGSTVVVEVPVTIVDALLSGEGEELNLRAALRSLESDFSGDLVRVVDGDTDVRVWVD